MKSINIFLSGFALAGAMFEAPAQQIVSTDAYSWVGDSIIQGEFKAYAVSPTEIVSNYSGRPHYFMPVEKRWSLRNDISSYPKLSGSNRLHQAIYNMGLDEMINAVEPDTTLRTGKEWAGVWTRDVSYSIILSMAALQPEASMISLMKKVNAEGQIIQDTGSGGAWPISTDRMVWALAAWEIYKVTGDRKWLEKVYPIVKCSFEKDFATVYDADGLVKGETSFIDWREQSYPKWMQTADIAQSVAMGTNVVHCAGLGVLADMAAALGKKKEAVEFRNRAEAMAAAIDKTFWLDDKGYYAMYKYGRDNEILNPRAETLGESLSILFDVAPAARHARITESNPVTPYGAAIFYPQISDMPSYHNNALWPFVGSYWALANAKAGNEEGTLQAIGAIFRPAALFATNKENFNLDNGDIFTELNSSNMLWSLSGNLALTNRILFGINFEPDGLRIAPFVPKALADTRTLENFPYRGAKLNVTVEGYGSKVKSITLNGKVLDPMAVIPSSALRKGGDIKVVMADNDIEPLAVNKTSNRKAPITPTAWLTASTEMVSAGAPAQNLLEWNPIEYIDHYIVLKNGVPVSTTKLTSWPATDEAEWQVVGVSADGTQSFASEPRSNRSYTMWQMPGESLSMVSPEISYKPSAAVEGFYGKGFVETDHKSAAIDVPVEVPSAGRYTVALRYANGNGPVNTENKAAVRTLKLNGKKIATMVMPQRGTANWNDWGLTNRAVVELPAGKSVLTIAFEPEDENMNLSTNHALIDCIVITRM